MKPLILVLLLSSCGNYLKKGECYQDGAHRESVVKVLSVLPSDNYEMERIVRFIGDYGVVFERDRFFYTIPDDEAQVRYLNVSCEKFDHLASAMEANANGRDK